MILGIIGLVYLIIGPILHTVAFVLMDVCDVMEPWFEDMTGQSYLNTFGKYTEDFNDMLTSCLFGDGNM